MYIETLSYIQNKQERLTELENIFFLTAKAEIETSEKKQSLFEKYAKPYIQNWPDDVHFACEISSKKTIGYLIGCRDSLRAEPIFKPLLKSYDVFLDQFKKYPAHLHMNIHPDYQGTGVGTFLIQEYLLELKKAKIKGVHIITSPHEGNSDFYKKNKFIFKLEREFNSHKLLFMGNSL